MKWDKFTGHWDEIFKESERYNSQFTKRIGVIVSNVKPSHETARNIYKEDREEIEAAAAKNGFKCIYRCNQIHFLKILP